MISVEINKVDLLAAKVEVRNLPGTLFAGTSPLLKPFMKKMEDILPPEKRGRGDSYILSALHSYIDEVHADENLIRIKSGDKIIEITRDELGARIGDKYPTSDHQRLSLPGLLFLQSSPSLQGSAVSKLKKEHNLKLPEGRRTLRYIFHYAVVSIDANKDLVKVAFDLSRLPKRADGSEALA